MVCDGNDVMLELLVVVVLVVVALTTLVEDELEVVVNVKLVVVVVVTKIEGPMTYCQTSLSRAAIESDCPPK